MVLGFGMGFFFFGSGSFFVNEIGGVCRHIRARLIVVFAKAVSWNLRSL